MRVSYLPLTDMHPLVTPVDNNGIVELSVALKQESIAGQPMFVVRVVSATRVEILERRRRDLRIEYVNAMLQADEASLTLHKLTAGSKSAEKSQKGMMDRLKAVEETIRKATEEKESLLASISTEGAKIINLDADANIQRVEVTKWQSRARELPVLLGELDITEEKQRGWFPAILAELSDNGKLRASLAEMKAAVSNPITPPTNGEESDLLFFLLRQATKYKLQTVLQELLSDDRCTHFARSKWETLMCLAARKNHQAAKLLAEAGAETTLEEHSRCTDSVCLA